jgi:hypothetical protein
MDITKLTSTNLGKIQKLLRKKEQLLTKVEDVDALLRGFDEDSGSKITKRQPKAAKGPKKARGKRGEMKDKIIAALKAAGKDGIHTKDLAAKLGKPVQNVAVWFHATGKKIKQIKKVKPATYAWVE